eukprot:Skav226036  [mRNA]  locus=scaffold2502:138576:148927:- [translate_table: standard]
MWSQAFALGGVPTPNSVLGSAGQSNGVATELAQPVPPVRQRERFSSLKLEEAPEREENPIYASHPAEHLEVMELAMAPTEGLEQMPMHVPIGNLGQQVSVQPLSQQQTQLLQQLNQKTNQQHLQTLLLQQALQGTPQQPQQQAAQLPNLLTGRMLDPTGALPSKTGTMPGGFCHLPWLICSTDGFASIDAASRCADHSGTVAMLEARRL